MHKQLSRTQEHSQTSAPAYASPSLAAAAPMTAMGTYAYAGGVVQRQAVGTSVSVPGPNAVGAGGGEDTAAGVNRTGLPDNLKGGIEALSGISLDRVKVHYNSPQPAKLQAHAYTQGSDIHLASGQEKHLPHEAWHVVQQSQQRVRATLQLKGAHINDDTSLETEADVMGARALHTPANQGTGSTMATAASTGCIQRQAILPDRLTLEAIILFLQEVIAESSEVSIADQKRIFNFMATISRAANRRLLPTYNDLYRQPQYAEGGLIYKDIYESKKKPKAPPRKRIKTNEGKAVSVEDEFSDADSELSDNDLDIEDLYDKQPSLYQPAVDHSDSNQVEGVVNPRNTNMLAFQDRSLIPASINGTSNTNATRKGKRKLSGKLKAGSDDLRAKQERLLFGSHLKQAGSGTFNSSIDTLKRRTRQGQLVSAPVKRLVSTSRRGFTIVDTEHHAEQSLLRSKTWDAIKKRLVQQIKASTSPTDVPKVDDRSNAILLTFVLNRSSCRGCGLALSLALIEFWEQLGVAMDEDKLSWQEVMKKYANRVRFVIRFPTIYEYNSENRIGFANIKEVLTALLAAGWEVAPIRPNIKGGLDSHDKLVEILKELKGYPSEADFKFFRAGGVPTKSGGKSGQGLGAPPLLLQPAASVERIPQAPLGAYLTTIDPAWDQPFNLPQAGSGGGVAGGGVFAHQVIANNPQDVLPPRLEPDDEAELLDAHGLRVHRNDGMGALCFIYSILMGLTGQSQQAVRPMVNYIAQQTGAVGGWINADNPIAVAVVAEIERIYGIPIDLAVVQQGVEPTVSARGGHAGGRVVVIRQTQNHYDAYVPE